jgi:hypothetical protein
MLKKTWFRTDSALHRSVRGRGEGTFADVRTKQKNSRRNTVIMLLLATAGVGWLYFLFGSGFFRITRIETGDLIYLDRGEVVAETERAMDEQGTWPWQWRNSLTINTAALEKSLETRLYADHVAVEKSYPSVLRLKIEERQSSVIVLAEDDLVLVDRKGIAVKRITSDEQVSILDRIAHPSPTAKTDLPILTIRQSPRFAPGEQYVDALTVEHWLDAFNALSEAGFGYRNAILEEATSTRLILNLFEPYDVYFDLLAPVKPQIEEYYIFMKSKPADAKINDYVDVRVPGRVFYK